MTSCSDFDLWLHLVCGCGKQRSNIYEQLRRNIPIILCKYRWHKNVCNMGVSRMANTLSPTQDSRCVSQGTWPQPYSLDWRWRQERVWQDVNGLSCTQTSITSCGHLDLQFGLTYGCGKQDRTPFPLKYHSCGHWDAYGRFLMPLSVHMWLA